MSNLSEQLTFDETSEVNKEDSVGAAQDGIIFEQEVSDTSKLENLDKYSNTPMHYTHSATSSVLKGSSPKVSEYSEPIEVVVSNVSASSLPLVTATPLPDVTVHTIPTPEVVMKDESKVVMQNESEVVIQNEPEVVMQNESEVVIQNESEVVMQIESEDFREDKFKVVRENESEVVKKNKSAIVREHESEVARGNESEFVREHNADGRNEGCMMPMQGVKDANIHGECDVQMLEVFNPDASTEHGTEAFDEDLNKENITEDCDFEGAADGPSVFNDVSEMTIASQVKEIQEENDKTEYTEQLERYKETDSADAFASKLLARKPLTEIASKNIGKQRSNMISYDVKGFQTVEFFPRTEDLSYGIILDGHRMYLSGKRQGYCIFRCTFKDSGCSVRLKVCSKTLLKLGEHNHSNSAQDACNDARLTERNWHYTCIYCSKDFHDLKERKSHILSACPMIENVILEDECIFTEWDTTPYSGSEQFEPEPIDKEEFPDDAENYPLPNVSGASSRVYVDKANCVFVVAPGTPVDEDRIFPVPDLGRDHGKSTSSPGQPIRIKNSKRRRKTVPGGHNGARVAEHIDDIINSTDKKVSMYCEACDLRFESVRQLSSHKLSKKHKAKLELLLEEEARERAILVFDKPIFTPEFLDYNKKMEAELRKLRKGAVELEEQNAVLSSHIEDMRGVLNELSNAKHLMQARHDTLESHLRHLKSELSGVFSTVLSEEVTADNFNDTFNRISMAIAGGGSRRGRLINDLKKQLRSVHIDTVRL